MEYQLQRALELRAIAHFIDDRTKQGALLWLAQDYETAAEREGTAGPAPLVRRLHMMRMVERLRPVGNLLSGEHRVS
ncbi:MAG TPA: hypothetical protein VKR31_14755 [Rhizomicrobium sp.]|nr:hypothetical protein [Rhizomicrobium sp.]